MLARCKNLNLVIGTLHCGLEIQIPQLTQLNENLRSFSEDKIVMGDTNIHEETGPKADCLYKVMNLKDSCPISLRNTKEMLTYSHSNSLADKHDMEGRVDRIFYTNEDWKVADFKLLFKEAPFVTDHTAVLTTFLIPERTTKSIYR